MASTDDCCLPSSLLPPRRRSPSLQANEEMISDEEEEEEEREGSQLPACIHPPTALPSSSLQAPLAPASPPSSSTLPSGSGAELGAGPGVGPGSTRSDSASPYPDDESFASFVAREIHEAASGASDDRSSLSPSPSPTPPDPSCMGADIQALLSQTRSSSSYSSPSPIVTGFGVTANCPPTPVQLPEGAMTAVSVCGGGGGGGCMGVLFTCGPSVNHDRKFLTLCPLT